MKIHGESLTVLRPGAITPEMLLSVCDDVKLDEGILDTLPEGVRPEAPGMKYRHYAPRAKVYLVKSDGRDGENRLQQEEADYQKRKEQQEKDRALAQKYTDIAKSVASDYGTTIGEMIADGELTMKNFLKETLLMSVDALEKVVEICVVEVMARNLAATAPFSFIGAAKAALQIAAIKAGFAVVKGLIGNFYIGGYTGGGAWDEPKGVVHSNEFVANRFAVANPSVRPVLDLINQAQRNNTISTLSAADISRVLPGANGGQTIVVQNDNPELMRLIAECSQTMQMVHERFRYPIKAAVSVSGRDGIDQATKDFNSMNNNVSR